MKTIDKVIFEAPYTLTSWEADALYYLKEYQGYLIGKEISELFDEAFTEMYNKNVDANQEKPHGDA